MKFTEVTVHTASEGSELVADVLWRYTNYGVAINDVADVLALQRDNIYWDYMDDSLKAPSETLVKAFIPLEDTEKALSGIRADLEELRSACGGEFPLGTLETGKRVVEGDEWLEIWKTHFRPLHIGEKVVVCPEWIKYEARPEERVIKLDSNMAFGTGEHETTAMCLKLLQKYITTSSVCADIGCGSGILGIAAVKLGAAEAYLSDIDEVAVKSALHNCKINGVADKTRVIKGDLLEKSDVKCDIMLANITAEILCRLAPSVPATLKKGGALILSGIITSRLNAVISAFTAVGLTLEERLNEGEWHALSFRL